jgi:hypothetical protein
MEFIDTYDGMETDNCIGPANPPPQSSALDYLWSFAASLIIILVFVVQEPSKMMHWMLVPLFLCGVLVGADALRWFRGKYTLFDPKGIIGIYGINFFLIAPLLVVFYDVEGIETYKIDAWQPLVGLMATFNCIGLIVYKIFQKIGFKRPSKVQWTYWSLNGNKALFYVSVVCLISFVSFCLYIFRAGGFGSVILQSGQNEMIYALKDFGIIMVLRDALPMATLIAFTVFRISGSHYGKSGLWLFVGIGVLILFFVTSGLRGSRAATAYGLICAGGIIHYFWRRVSVPMVLLALIPLGLFFYIYGFYKSAGITGITDLLKGQISIQGLQEQTSRSFSGMLIGDLSRTPVQAAELDVLINKPWSYQYRYGITYPYAFGYFFPRRVLSWFGIDKPIDMGRIPAGTEMLYGPGSYGPYQKFGGSGSRSTQLYGLAGEAMLNFGIWGIPAAFAVWGYIVGRLRKRLYSYQEGDIRLFMSGFWMLLSFVMLAADADILVWFFLSLYVIPATLTFLISDKTRLGIA